MSWNSYVNVLFSFVASFFQWWRALIPWPAVVSLLLSAQSVHSFLPCLYLANFGPVDHIVCPFNCCWAAMAFYCVYEHTTTSLHHKYQEYFLSLNEYQNQLAQKKQADTHIFQPLCCNTSIDCQMIVALCNKELPTFHTRNMCIVYIHFLGGGITTGSWDQSETNLFLTSYCSATNDLPLGWLAWWQASFLPPRLDALPAQDPTPVVLPLGSMGSSQHHLLSQTHNFMKNMAALISTSFNFI